MNSEGVSDLNSGEQVCQPFGISCAGGRHECWQDLVRSDFGLPAMEGISPNRDALWGRLSRPDLDLCRAVPLYGFRSTDLPGEPARHRSMPVGPSGQTLSHGVSCPGESLDVGRCERRPRLADLCRVCPAPDWPSPDALRQRRLRCGVDQHGLCPGRHHHRSVPVDVPVGAISHGQGRGEAAHAARICVEPFPALSISRMARSTM